MDNLLIDRETLGQFIDELIKKKPLPVNTAEELAAYREQQIEALDARVAKAFLGDLTDEQYAELDHLLDDPATEPQAFEDFYQNAGIDVQAKVADELKAFADEYLGGQNA